MAKFKAAISTLVAVGVFVLTGCATSHVEPFATDLAEVRSFREVRVHLASIARSHDHVVLEELGPLRYEGLREPMPVVQILPGTSNPPSGSKPLRVLVIAGVHGNEPGGGAWALELVEALAADPRRFGNVAIDVFPIINVWGWVHDVRYNADGQDINRDFASYRTQEATLFRSFVADNRYDLVIDHHEDSDATGFYLYQYGLRDDSWSRQVIAAVRAQGMSIEQDVNMIILSTDDGLIDAPMWGLRYMRLTGQLSITNYMRLKRNLLVFTAETPTAVEMSSRVNAHRLAFEEFVHRVAEMREMEGQQ